MNLHKWLQDNNYEDVILFENYSYDTAFVGVSEDNRAIYDYDLMIEYLIKQGFGEIEAIEWIDYNTIRYLPYMGEKAPIILHRMTNDNN